MSCSLQSPIDPNALRGSPGRLDAVCPAGDNTLLIVSAGICELNSCVNALVRAVVGASRAVTPRRGVSLGNALQARRCVDVHVSRLSLSLGSKAKSSSRITTNNQVTTARGHVAPVPVNRGPENPWREHVQRSRRCRGLAIIHRSSDRTIEPIKRRLNNDANAPRIQMSCGDDRLLSPLIRNHYHHMGLVLIPRPIGLASSDLPPGMTHSESEPCPFKRNGRSADIADSCCSFRFGYDAACLMAFAVPPPFYLRIHDDISPEEAIEFGRKLRDAIKQLRDDTVAAGREADAADDADMDGVLGRGINASDWEFPVEPALKEIERAAAWCEKIGRMHFGVRSGY